MGTQSPESVDVASVSAAAQCVVECGGHHLLLYTGWVRDEWDSCGRGRLTWIFEWDRLGRDWCVP